MKDARRIRPHIHALVRSGKMTFVLPCGSGRLARSPPHCPQPVPSQRALEPSGSWLLAHQASRGVPKRAGVLRTFGSTAGEPLRPGRSGLTRASSVSANGRSAASSGQPIFLGGLAPAVILGTAGGCWRSFIHCRRENPPPSTLQRYVCDQTPPRAACTLLPWALFVVRGTKKPPPSHTPRQVRHPTSPPESRVPKVRCNTRVSLSSLPNTVRSTYTVTTRNT